MVLALCHAANSGWTPVENLDDLSSLAADPNSLLWIEVPARELTQRQVATLARDFEIDPAALDRAARSSSRPRLDPEPEYVVLVLHQLDEVAGQLEAGQMTFFIGHSFVLAVHDGADRTLEEAKRRWANLRAEGPPYLVHTLLNVIVDDYEEIVGDLEDAIERLEEMALASPEVPTQKELYSVRQRVARLRRYALPVVRILDHLDDPEARVKWPDATLALFRDVHDHVLRMVDEVRSIDDLSQAVLELQRAEQGHRLSDINKKLTAWAAIIAVPTFIASIYGMNFALYPREGSSFGFWFSLAVMAVIALCLYVSFKRKRWL